MADSAKATHNRVTQIVSERAKAAGLPLEPFTVHDLRRTGSTLLNEVGFNGDWIDGRTHVTKLLSENVVVPVLSAAL